MAADKVPTIVESAQSNGNRRTVLSATLATGATAPPHYHTQFSETFKLVKGTLAVYMSPDMSEETLAAHALAIGESVTVPPGTLHTFRVSDEEAVTATTFEPRPLNFERAMLI